MVVIEVEMVKVLVLVMLDFRILITFLELVYQVLIVVLIVEVVMVVIVVLLE